MFRTWHSRVLFGDECWEWVGKSKQTGYGRFTIVVDEGRCATVMAHRFAYELLVGPIPRDDRDLTIDHLCRNRLCQNPSHMEVVTRGENTRRASVKDFCIRGHDLSIFRYNNPNPSYRVCRLCKTATVKRYYERKKKIMADIVDPSELVRSVGRAKVEYPWSEWTDGQTRRVTQGKDFSCTAKSFRSVLAKYGAANGLKPVIGSPVEGDDSVVFRFEPRPAGYVPRTRVRKATAAETAATGETEVTEALVGSGEPEVVVPAPEAVTELPAEGEDSSFDW